MDHCSSADTSARPCAIRLRLAGGYFLIQGLATIIWWALLLRIPDARSWFLDPTWDWEFIRLFAPADIVAFGGASLCAGVLAIGRSRYSIHSAWLICGAALYAMLMTLTMFDQDRVTSLALMLMVFALACTVLAALLISRECRR